MQATDLEATVHAYLEAFEQRDLDKCVAFFADDAKIHFGPGVYQGREAIAGWHQDRFNAEFEVLKIDKIRVKGKQVIVDAVGTSKVARQWRFNSIAGKATFTFDDGKIKEVSFGLRMAIPLERW